MHPSMTLCAPDFEQFGIERLAYVKRVSVEGAPAYVLCAADGTELMPPAREVDAIALAAENDLETVSLH